jgi:hypothetical protein
MYAYMTDGQIYLRVVGDRLLISMYHYVRHTSTRTQARTYQVGLAV